MASTVATSLTFSKPVLVRRTSTGPGRLLFHRPRRAGLTVVAAIPGARAAKYLSEAAAQVFSPMNQG